MHLESLENRRLLSASLNATSGLLTITGTDNPDHIAAFKFDGKLIVSETTFVPKTSTKPASVLSHKTSFALSSVKSILVNAGGGNDSASLAGFWGAWLSIPSTINGGAGNDWLVGGNGADSISGNAGNDHIEGRGGADILHGNDGRDYLVGGAGADQIYGDAGNDFINALDGSGTDKVDGGTNDAVSSTSVGDVAIVDKTDSVINVEVVRKFPSA